MKKFTILKQGAVALCLFVMLSCGTQSAEQPQQQSYATEVAVAEDVTINRKYSAAIRGRQDIDIYAQVAGTITKVCVTEGQSVKRGQSLFVIDQVPFEAAKQIADANVEAAEAAVATAELVAKSKQKLFDRGVVSEFELQTANNNYATAKAQLAQARAAKINADNNYNYTLVKSPADGVVGTIPFRVGTLVSPQTPVPLTTVSDNSTMYVYFSMGESALLDLVYEYGSMDKALKSMSDVTLLLANGKQYSEAGRIESVSGVINTSTGSVSVRAAFPNKGRLLNSGASGNILMPQQYKGCVTVPKSATYEIQDQIYIYKVVNGVAQSSRITVAKDSTTERYIVLTGLEAGEEILTEGVAFVHNGDKVK
ncbi:MAG: efflux RND transporter periplasmic adaptor subunit [Alistipes sp.]|nr:efflux RND transporter periplasmic adaptor subunit [Alistipes sp.]